ncbi:hypothetical protein [Amycolatopsis sp. H20-H5]|uniref:hypothetical protein n=1 Tax=Amycolatopsis sp. H20-H5 TaxID=3046309 RepID=UPI002DBB00A1|nr:hypothetical protein [Amycolatopsis sp. H20-H5]MEC3976587.1 hypothetical protein [Amycolatopsis sp. H20-H5]
MPRRKRAHRPDVASNPVSPPARVTDPAEIPSQPGPSWRLPSIDEIERQGSRYADSLQYHERPHEAESASVPAPVRRRPASRSRAARRRRRAVLPTRVAAVLAVLGLAGWLGGVVFLQWLSPPDEPGPSTTNAVSSTPTAPRPTTPVAPTPTPAAPPVAPEPVEPPAPSQPPAPSTPPPVKHHPAKPKKVPAAPPEAGEPSQAPGGLLDGVLSGWVPGSYSWTFADSDRRDLSALSLDSLPVHADLTEVTSALRDVLSPSVSLLNHSAGSGHAHRPHHGPAAANEDVVSAIGYWGLGGYLLGQ